VSVSNALTFVPLFFADIARWAPRARRDARDVTLDRIAS
jgi:hypothetical protein